MQVNQLVNKECEEKNAMSNQRGKTEWRLIQAQQQLMLPTDTRRLLSFNDKFDIFCCTGQLVDTVNYKTSMLMPMSKILSDSISFRPNAGLEGG